jgi:hypothetical protein
MTKNRTPNPAQQDLISGLNSNFKNINGCSVASAVEHFLRKEEVCGRIGFFSIPACGLPTQDYYLAKQ